MDHIKTEDILNSELRIEAFPFFVQDLSHLIGIEATLRLVNKYQGIEMWVPKQYQAGHILEQLIGEIAFKKLIQNFGSESYEIPKCDLAIRTVRNKLIRASTSSQRDLAVEWKLTIRQIRNIQKGYQRSSRLLTRD